MPLLRADDLEEVLARGKILDTLEKRDGQNANLIIIIMAEMASILRGLATSPWVLILNKFTIYNIWHIRWRKPCLLPGWTKNSSYYNATAEIRTSDLPNSMATTNKKVSRSYPLGHKRES